MLSVGKVVVFVAIFGKEYGSFSPTNFERFFFSQKPFRLFYDLKKVPMTNKHEGKGGLVKALVFGLLKKFFLRLPSGSGVGNTLIATAPPPSIRY